jgi:muramidase (phage lysozyme)
MTRATSQQLGGQNVCAFLDMLAISEGTHGLGDDGYNVVGGGKLFNNGYAQHPELSIWLPRYEIYSTAAGRGCVKTQKHEIFVGRVTIVDVKKIAWWSF